MIPIKTFALKRYCYCKFNNKFYGKHHVITRYQNFRSSKKVSKALGTLSIGIDIFLHLILPNWYCPIIFWENLGWFLGDFTSWAVPTSLSSLLWTSIVVHDNISACSAVNLFLRSSYRIPALENNLSDGRCTLVGGEQKYVHSQITIDIHHER